MGFLNSYLASIMAVGVCAFLCETVGTTRSGEHTLSKGLTFITSLCIFLTVLSPFFKELKMIDLSAFYQTDAAVQNNTDYFLSLTQSETEKTLINYIKNIVEAEIYNLDAKLSNNNGELAIKEIIVTINTDDVSKETEIINALKNAAGKDVSVIINVLDKKSTDGNN